MGQIIAWCIAVLSVCCAGYFRFMQSLTEEELDALEKQLQAEKDRSAMLESKYDSLVEDIKKVAMRPQYVPRDPEQKIPKAPSAAALRRMNDQMNAKVLTEADSVQS